MVYPLLAGMVGGLVETIHAYVHLVPLEHVIRVMIPPNRGFGVVKMGGQV